MDFFVGLDNASHAWPFRRCMLSVNMLARRKHSLRVNDWLMDSGAFTEITRHGKWRTGVEHYAKQIEQWASSGNLLAAVSQDYMCEDFALKKTGLSIAEHQRLTIERYRQLVPLVCTTVMPVLQGYFPKDYASHLTQYGTLLRPGCWVGIGSVCKRNSNPNSVEAILRQVKGMRPDLKLHGFGLKISALKNPAIRSLLHSCDSMAWSYESWRDKKKDKHDPRLALAYCARVQKLLKHPCFVQDNLFEWWTTQ